MARSTSESILAILPRAGDIIERMDGFDFPGDVCDRCRHTLRDNGSCPSCDWKRPPVTEGEVLAEEVEAWLEQRGDVGGSP